MNEKIKNILITGGTGFIGKHLCECLLKNGYNLYVLTRDQKKTRNKNEEKKLYFTNLNQIQNIDIDIIINLSGETVAQRWTKNSKNKIYASRISTTQSLIDYIKSKKLNRLC